jgi:hypothetical protein
MATIKQRTIRERERPIFTAAGYMPISAPANTAVQFLENTYTASPGNPSPNRGIIEALIEPSVYIPRYFPDAPHFERLMPVETTTFTNGMIPQKGLSL